MRIVKGLLAVVLATGCFCTAAWADVNWGDTATASDTTAAASSDANANEAAAPAADSYGRTADEIAVNQGIVAYWYAHGYANCNGGFPAKLGELSSMGLPLRKWVSPHTGEAIDPDDGKLDFDGDFTYTTGCNDVTITVKTSSGDVSVPGTFSGTDGCCNGRCCDIYICGFECWKCCGQECVCEIVQWIMWRSFETYECMYGSRPCDEMVWIASGLAPIDKNWKEMAPFMEIEYIWGNCCLKKAKVHCCCNPCMDRCASKCNSCGDKCGSCNKCGTQNKCNSCNSCNKCGTSKCNSCKKPSCNSCAKPSCGGCGKCNSCVKPSCGSCGKSNCNSCAKPACGKCGTTTKCGSCGGCNKCGTSKCNSCAKPSCGSCGKSSCNSCGKKSSCGGCGKSSCGSCSKCNSCAKSTCNTCNSCSSRVRSRMWEEEV